jgi:hypothetical protein
MTGLRETLAEVRARIERYQGRRRLGEQNTKATLIEPVLRSLGWDVEDLDEVQREYRVKRRDKPVDYALLLLRSPRLFLEAKGLGQDLSDRRWINQVMGYATVAGVEWIALTDGNEYRLYNAHAPVHAEEKLFRRVRISDEGTLAQDTLALLSREHMKENRLEMLWKAHFVDRQVHKVLEDLLEGGADASLVRLLRKRTENLSPADIRASLARAHVEITFPAVEVTRPAATAGVTGRRKRAPGHSERRKPQRVDVGVRDLIEAGLVRAPLDLVKRYKGKDLTARIEPDGGVRCLGEVFNSLSLAAGRARASVIGSPPGRKYPQTNGWTFWKYRDASGALKEVDDLRRSYLRATCSGPAFLTGSYRRRFPRSITTRATDSTQNGRTLAAGGRACLTMNYAALARRRMGRRRSPSRNRTHSWPPVKLRAVRGGRPR